MKRREFITLLGGAAAAWPLAAHAQQGERVRRIGALMYLAADDPESPARMAAFARGLQELGWIEGSSGSALAALQNATRTVPIVFVNVTDPVGAGYVASLSRPGANTTGFTLFEYGTSGKWLELLKQIAPAMTRAAVIRDPSITSGTAQFAAIQAVAPLIGVELTPVDARDASGIEQTLAGFARGSNCGLIVTASPSAFRRRELIIALAARHQLPAVYPGRAFVVSGGLISYGTDEIEQQRRAAGYVDRILRGEKPADLPVQAPTKYELIINLKTAKALGLEVPPSLLARADEVIE